MTYKKNSIKGYCDYCKDPIYNDDFVVEVGALYHKFCYQQKNTYYDEFENKEELKDGTNTISK